MSTKENDIYLENYYEQRQITLRSYGKTDKDVKRDFKGREFIETSGGRVDLPINELAQ